MSPEGEREPGPEQRVVVVGLGLMGGSLCRALKAGPDPPTVVGVDVDAAQGSRARDAGAIDRFEMDGEGPVAEADTIVYATALGAARSLMREHAGRWREDALVTDVVSLKAPLLRLAEAEGFGARFVGAHPICGGEASGFGATHADLYRNARIWLCAAPEAAPPLRSRAEAFWRRVGGSPAWIDAQEHDERMAWVSHLPQLVANALTGALDAAGYGPEELGPGGRDMTRLAGSNPDIWRDLLEASAPFTGAGLTSVSRALEVLADLLARREIDRVREFMERTREWRDRAPGEQTDAKGNPVTPGTAAVGEEEGA